MYHVECCCRNQVSVQIHQCSSDVRCPSCGSSVAVPDSITLQKRSGDKYPGMRPIDKLLTTAAKHEHPFDGMCHKCQERGAEFQVPVNVSWMGADASSQHSTFPLLLCGSCRQSFDSERNASNWALAGRLALFLGLLPIVVVATCEYAPRIELDSGVARAVASIVAFATLAAIGRRFRKLKPRFIDSWLAGIRWAPEAIKSESEYLLTLGRVTPYEAPKK